MVVDARTHEPRALVALKKGEPAASVVVESRMRSHLEEGFGQEVDNDSEIQVS